MRCPNCKKKMSDFGTQRHCACGLEQIRIPGTHRWSDVPGITITKEGNMKKERKGHFTAAKVIVQSVMQHLWKKKVKKDTAKCRTCTYFETTVCSSGCMMSLQVESCGGPFDGEEGMSNQEVL